MGAKRPVTLRERAPNPLPQIPPSPHRRRIFTICSPSVPLWSNSCLLSSAHIRAFFWSCLTCKATLTRNLVTKDKGSWFNHPLLLKSRRVFDSLGYSRAKWNILSRNTSQDLFTRGQRAVSRRERNVPKICDLTSKPSQENGGREGRGRTLKWKIRSGCSLELNP